MQTRGPEPVNILTAMAENEAVVKNGTTRSEGQSHSRGCSISSVTFTNPYTLHSYSLLSIPKATEAGMKFVWA